MCSCMPVVGVQHERYLTYTYLLLCMLPECNRLTMQICLAAERCKHVAFDSKPDMWWSHEGFRCDEAPAGDVSFGSILLKASCL